MFIMKSSKRVIICFLCSGILAACGKEEKKAYSPSIIPGMATPIYLPLEGGEVLLSDYFLDTNVIDSISPSVEYESKLSRDKKSVSLRPTKELGFVSNLRVWALGVPNDIPIYKSTEEVVTFALPDAENTYKSVMIKGGFNGWVPERSVMEYANGQWTYSARFSPGAHQYVLVVDGEQMLDPTNPKKVPNGAGGMNSLLEVGTKAEKVTISSQNTENVIVTISTSQPLTKLLVYVDNQLVPQEQVVFSKESFEIELPTYKSGRSYAHIFGYNENGRSNDLLIPLEDGMVVTDPSVLKRQDFHTQIMYFLMVDRFKDGDPSNTKKVDSDEILPIANYFGGDLQGVVDKIEDGYFEALGVNTIWLSPITQNPEKAYGLWKKPRTKFSGYHGYWPISNTHIDDRFGNSKKMEDLIEKAHQKNMNVILDYVANHVHEEHPLYQQHKDWATDLYLPDSTLNTEKWDSHRLTTWFDTFLPTFDFSKSEVVETMTDSAVFWITDFELDGFRHDATKHISEEFWRTLTHKIKSNVNRPIYQVGETYGSHELIRSYINTGMLDAQFDFNLYDASVQAFANPNSNFEPLVSALEQSLEYYGSNHLMGNITGNQDRARFISYASGDVRFDEDAKVAGWTRDIIVSDSTAYQNLAMLHAFKLSIPGVPCIYYGDEYGSPGGNDPDNRRMMKFEGLAKQELMLRETVTKLTALRRDHMALIFGDTEVVRVDEQALVLKRSYFGEEVWTLFNKSSSPIQASIPIRGGQAQFGQEYTREDEEMLVSLKPKSFEMIVRPASHHAVYPIH